MGRSSPRLASLCLKRVATRVRFSSPPIKSKPPHNATNNSFHSLPDNFSAEKTKSTQDTENSVVAGQKIMIVVDSSSEAKSAMQWTLSHTVQNQDTLVLLHVCKPPTPGEDGSAKGHELLQSMKSICQIKKPEVQVEVALVEGKEKGPAIVEAARAQGISLLVLGHRRQSIAWRLLMAWSRNRVAGGTVDYCIENAGCMTLAVRKKSRRLGGYLITTKRHKDFWLLA